MTCTLYVLSSKSSNICVSFVWIWVYIWPTRNNFFLEEGERKRGWYIYFLLFLVSSTYLILPLIQLKWVLTREWRDHGMWPWHPIEPICLHPIHWTPSRSWTERRSRVETISHVWNSCRPQHGRTYPIDGRCSYIGIRNPDRSVQSLSVANGRPMTCRVTHMADLGALFERL